MVSRAFGFFDGAAQWSAQESIPRDLLQSAGLWFCSWHSVPHSRNDAHYGRLVVSACSPAVVLCRSSDRLHEIWHWVPPVVAMCLRFRFTALTARFLSRAARHSDVLSPRHQLFRVQGSERGRRRRSKKIDSVLARESDDFSSSDQHVPSAAASSQPFGLRRLGAGSSQAPVRCSSAAAPQERQLRGGPAPPRALTASRRPQAKRRLAVRTARYAPQLARVRRGPTGSWILSNVVVSGCLWEARSGMKHQIIGITRSVPRLCGERSISPPGASVHYADGPVTCPFSSAHRRISSGGCSTLHCRPARRCRRVHQNPAAVHVLRRAGFRNALPAPEVRSPGARATRRVSHGTVGRSVLGFLRHDLRFGDDLAP